MGRFPAALYVETNGASGLVSLPYERQAFLVGDGRRMPRLRPGILNVGAA